MYCKAHPDEKGIETYEYDPDPRPHIIAKHIPTKRELKLNLGDLLLQNVRDCKAHPDEKGIETVSSRR